MTYLAAGLAHNGRLPSNCILTVTPSAGGTSTFDYPGSAGAATASTQTQYGPFARDLPYKLTANSMPLDYFVRRSDVPAAMVSPV